MEWNTKMSLKKWQELKNLLYDFTNSTSLHGYSFLSKTHGIVLKIIWIFIIMIFSAMAITLFIVNTLEYMHSKIETTIETQVGNLDVS